MREHNKYLKTLNVLFALLVCLALVACGRKIGPNINATPTQPKPQVILFLIDPTNSLTGEENNQVAALATDMFQHLPSGSRYGVYPIQFDAQRVLPIIPDDVVPASFKTDVDKRHYEKKKAELKVAIESKVEDQYKTDDKIADDRRSCILNMLRFAEKQLKQISRTEALDPEKGTYRLVIISDMVEECRDSPLGEIRLNKRDLTKEIQLADNYTQLTSPPDLTNVHITVIFPLTNQSPPDLNRRPSDRDLMAFWEKIFRHCQKKEKWSWNPQYIEWISNGQLPGWFLEEKTKTEEKSIATR